MDQFVIRKPKPKPIEDKTKKSPQKKKESNKSNPPSENLDPVKTQLWCQSSLIPYKETKEYHELLEWATNWSQSQPACLLFGPISCGKSRAIEMVATALKSYLYEIDCTSTASIKELINNCEESTKSKSVGIFLNQSQVNYDESSSFIVLEHIDSLIPLHSEPTKPLINLISKSRVPLMMTSQSFCFPQSEWLKIIPFDYPPDPYSIIKSAVWMKNIKQLITTNQAIHSLLSFTDQDIRRASLQYQVCQNYSNFALTRDDSIYLSIPMCIGHVQDQKDKRHLYSDLMDLFLVVDHNDQIFDKYIKYIPDTFMSKRREHLYESYADFSKRKVPHTRYSPFEDLEMTELVYEACVNDIPVTRQRTKAALQPPHKILPSDIQFVKQWKLWPNIRKDIPHHETEEVTSTSSQSNQNQTMVQAKEVLIPQTPNANQTIITPNTLVMPQMPNANQGILLNQNMLFPNNALLSQIPNLNKTIISPAIILPSQNLPLNQAMITPNSLFNPAMIIPNNGLISQNSTLNPVMINPNTSLYQQSDSYNLINPLNCLPQQSLNHNMITSTSPTRNDGLNQNIITSTSPARNDGLNHNMISPINILPYQYYGLNQNTNFIVNSNYIENKASIISPKGVPYPNSKLNPNIIIPKNEINNSENQNKLNGNEMMFVIPNLPQQQFSSPQMPNKEIQSGDDAKSDSEVKIPQTLNK